MSNVDTMRNLLSLLESTDEKTISLNESEQVAPANSDAEMHKRAADHHQKQFAKYKNYLAKKPGNGVLDAQNNMAFHEKARNYHRRMSKK